MTSPDKGLACHKDLTTHKTLHRQTLIPAEGFEPTIPASERPQTYALNRKAHEIGGGTLIWKLYFRFEISTFATLN